MSTPSEAFLCPITKCVMDHPVFTSLGTTYEYAAISQWLVSRDADPLTNAKLPSKVLIKNFLLRTQIQEWKASNLGTSTGFQSFPDSVPPPFETSSAELPPPAPDARAGASLLDRILLHSSTSARRTKAERSGDVPPVVTAHGREYEFRRQSGRLEVMCRGTSDWTPLPFATDALSVTPLGCVFYKRGEVHDAVVEQDESKPNIPTCRDGASCATSNCRFAHPYPCRFGLGCRGLGNGSCKLVHPSPDSVVPLGSDFPLSQACKFGSGCSNAKCHFAHPSGRVKIRRVPFCLPVTHSLDLQKLDKPLALDLGDLPLGATKFQFHGEFAFFFKPYPGAWAKEHFETCTVVRYSSKASSHKRVMEKSLAGHYCNAAVGCGGYVVLSWWPYEDEAMRAIHEGAKSLRAVEKTLVLTVKSSEAQSSKQQAEIARQQKALEAREAELAVQREAVEREKGAAKAANGARLQAERRAVQAERGAQATKASADALVANARFQAQGATRAAQLERDARFQAEKRAAQAQYQVGKARAQGERDAQYQADKARAHAERNAQYQAEKARREAEKEARRRAEAAWRSQMSERFRLRDPIHVYALRAQRSGDAEADWTLVLDYHKGAHALELDDSSELGGNQKLRVTEHNKVFEFDLVSAGEFEGIGTLPIVPPSLCDGF